MTKLSNETLLKLHKNPHFKMTEEQKEQLAERNLIKTIETVEHNTRVAKTVSKVKKHSTKLKKETDGNDNGFSGL